MRANCIGLKIRSQKARSFLLLTACMAWTPAAFAKGSKPLPDPDGKPADMPHPQPVEPLKAA